MSLQDPQAGRIKLKTEQLLPKLRKNRKIELRWGNDYYDAVNKAVFSSEAAPYMPNEPPVSIREDVDKTGYVCKQCRDCFRFLSSIEEHTSRRSWVLGYWCQTCFVTKCTHVSTDEPMCSTCQNVEASKNAYLAEKGVKKNVKKAVTKVFYNQCQYFAHLRMHGVLMVDLNEIMLMPLPNGITNENFLNFDKLCRAVMETMFLRRMHIMDWLREINVQSSRWDILLGWMESKKKSPISDILANYSENCVNPLDLAERTRKDGLRKLEEKTWRRADSGSPRDDEDPLAENEDSPNDIAFVDCGSTPSHVLVSEFPEVSPKISENYCTVKRADLWRSFSPQYPKFKEKPPDSETKAEEPPGGKVGKKAPRVLTIRSPKNLSLSTIMKHLPIDGITSNKIVVMADQNKTAKEIQPSNPENSAIKNASVVTESSKLKDKKVTSVVHVKSSKVKPKINLSTNVVEKSPRSLPLVTKSQSFSEQMSLHGRIVFQNGRKYIIRHVPKSKSQSILQNSIIKKMRNPPTMIVPVPGTKVPILPKPVTAMKIASISPGNQKAMAIARGARRAKLPVTVVNTPPGVTLTTAKPTSQMNKARVTRIQKSLTVRCREVLVSDLRRCSRKELEAYIDHLKEITERYSRTIKFEKDSANERAILCFENVLRETTNERPSSSSLTLESDREWEEKQANDSDKKRICETCCKRLKPASYIIGISVAGIDESVYCHCYNTVCHICETTLASVSQLKAHVRWHKGEKPHMCPSCSLMFPSSLDLEVHVWTTCFHPMASYIFGCGVCDIEGIFDMEAITRHFLLLHTRRKVICAECKMEHPEPEPTAEQLEKHFAEHHPEVKTISEPKRLLVCTLKQCILRPESFRSHLTDHIGVLKWISYKCPFCATTEYAASRSKSLMREHLVKNHLDRMHEIVSKESLSRILESIESTPDTDSVSLDGQTSVRSDDPSVPKILNARTIPASSFELGNDEVSGTKMPKILTIRSKAVEEFEEASNHFDVEILPVRSGRIDSPISNGKTLSTIKVKSQNAKKSLVPSVERTESSANQSQTGKIDGEDSSNSPEDVAVISMDSKVEDSENSSSFVESYSESQESDSKDFVAGQEMAQRPWRIALNNPGDSEAEPVVYNCHLCGELINTSWSVIKNHFDSRHSSDYEIFTVSPTIPRVRKSPESGREDANGKRRKVEIIPAPSAKRRRRWGPKKHVERPGSPSLGICVKPEPVEEIGGAFRCKKCEESFEDRDSLRNHIALQHRIKGQYLICLECGENFVVAPSLQMHLKALHGIEDPTSYLTKNSAYAPEILDDSEQDEKATESNQCYVCMAVFEDKSALDKHMRVHGMAFLRRKRFEAQKALKSFVKVNSPENTPKIGKTATDAVKLASDTGDGSPAKKEEIEDHASNPSEDSKTEIDSEKMEIEKTESLPIT